MKEFVKKIVPSKMKEMSVDIGEFISLYNKKQCELIDVRMDFETSLWQLNFGLKIPADELPERLNELPKDKLLVISCPTKNRSSLAMTYLISEGFNVKYLSDGLLGLMEYLKGSKAKELKL